MGIRSLLRNAFGRSKAAREESGAAPGGADTAPESATIPVAREESTPTPAPEAEVPAARTAPGENPTTATLPAQSSPVDRDGATAAGAVRGETSEAAKATEAAKAEKAEKATAAEGAGSDQAGASGEATATADEAVTDEAPAADAKASAETAATAETSETLGTAEAGETPDSLSDLVSQAFDNPAPKPAAAPEAEAATEATPEPAPATESADSTSEATDATPETAAATPKAEAKDDEDEVTTDAKTEPVDEPVGVPEAATTPEATTDPQVEARPEPEPKPQPAPEPQPEAAAAPEQAAAPEPKAPAQDEKPEAAAPAEAPAETNAEPAPAATAAPAFSLAKVESTAPGLVSLYKSAAGTLAKHNLATQRAAVYLVLDRSGSMRNYYKDGTVQNLAEQALGLSANLDDDGTVPVIFFSTDIDGTADIDLANYEGRIEELHAGLGHMGRTNYHWAINAVVEHYKKSGSTAPAFVIFQTDGAPTSKPAAEKALCEAAGLPIFWQFVGFGDPDAKGFDFLRKLDDLAVPEKRVIDNAGFFHAGRDPRSLSADALYQQLMVEFPEWLTEARAAGVLKDN
ncbi:VWA domain-containing protein [Streptomyces sp. NPDC048650]|uniref:VWA domain-containing protein n=1 Tax=Streptomyces sp. NPDC048650 TaxID=3365583 RepID=UPI00371C7651